MARRTREADAELIETADDLEELVQDKRQNWRANSSKARRTQRRYKNRLTQELMRVDIENPKENNQAIFSTVKIQQWINFDKESLYRRTFI